jgi:hypothetical protein
MTIQGWPRRMRGWDGHVPILRCFWHVEGPVLDDKSWILNIRYDFSVYKGHKHWELDTDY